MAAHSFFVEPGAIQGERVELRGPVAHQIRAVLRLGPGDLVDLLDNSGIAYTVRLVVVSRESVVAEVVERRRPATEPRVELRLYQALLKGQKMDLVLQKGTEIGVSRFVPVLSERCVSRPSAADLRGRQGRWEAIVREAAEQSGRALMPVVEVLVPFAEACKAASGDDLAIMAWEEERALGIGTVLREADLVGAVTPSPAPLPSKWDGVRRPRIALLVGPEGGFSPREAEIARAAGVRVATLGPRILRAETAALVAATLVLCETRDLGG